MEEALNAQMAARQTAAAPSGDRPKAEEKLARQPQAAQQPETAKPQAEAKREESLGAQPQPTSDQGQAGTPHRYPRHRRRKPCKI